MKEQVNDVTASNCKVNKTFNVTIKHPFFPIRGSGIVSENWCGVSSDRDYARLCTDENREILYCHHIYCDNFEEYS